MKILAFYLEKKGQGWGKKTCQKPVTDKNRTKGGTILRVGRRNF